MASRVSVVWERGGAWGSGKQTLLSPGWPLFQGLRRQQGTEQPFLKARHCAWHFTYTVSFSAHSNPFRKFYFSFLQTRKLKPRGVKSSVKVNTGSGWLNQDTRPGLSSVGLCCLQTMSAEAETNFWNGIWSWVKSVNTQKVKQIQLAKSYRACNNVPWWSYK